MEKKKVMIGLSGGVDSAVAAYLLKKAGYEVAGGFMRNWDAMMNNDYLGNPTRNDDMCPQEKDYLDAQSVAKILDIPLYRIDFVKEYWDYVFSYFLDEYKLGRTPNPDIFCNKFIKFETFRKFAMEKGFDYIAMGHYAKRVDKDGIAYLHKAVDENKDQTYFLSQVNQEQLSATLFPLGDIPKSEVRRIAHELGLISVQDKKDSTGVCFICERNFKEFLNNYLPAKSGDIVDINTNKVVGRHDGVLYYTLGQRRGLGIGGIKGIPTASWFVVSKDVKNNILYVSQGDENDYLLSTKALIKKVNWQSGNVPDVKDKDLSVKFRYRQKDHPCRINILDNGDVEVIYPPFKAVTPGQAAVIYDNEVMLGGGIIEKIYYNDEEKKGN